MQSRNVAISISKIIIFMMLGLMITPNQIQAQKREPKKKVQQVSPSRNYGHLPKRGVVTKSAPARARLITFRNIGYRFQEGIFYKSHQGQFVVVAPPIGIRITSLPAGHRTIIIRNHRYFYYYGTYYSAVGREYEVVHPPVGALVESIPDGFEEIEVEGNTYYVLDGTQYKAVIHQGEIWYEVIKVS